MPNGLTASVELDTNIRKVQQSMPLHLGEYHKQIMIKQVEAKLKAKQRNDHVGPVLNDVTPWECWASSKSDYLKNKQKLGRAMVF